VKGEAEALLQMQCIAEETGGRFLTADNAAELTEALQQVVAAPPIAIPATTELTLRAVMDGEVGSLVETPFRWTFNAGEDSFELEGNPGPAALPAGDWNITGYHVVLESEQTAQLSIFAGEPQTYVMVFAEPQPTLPLASFSAPSQIV